MTQRSLSTPTSGLRVFSACLLSALMIMMPFVQMAAATRANARVSGVRSPESEKNANTATENVFADPALPGPIAVPLVPTITATMTDAILNDDGDTKADPTNGVPGTTEKIEYTVTISNTGPDPATGVQYTNTIDSHTTLVAGSITTQPIAVGDSFNVLGNVRIQVPDGASDLLNNDCDPDPTGGPCTNAGLTITTLAGDSSAPFAGTSTNGGNVTATTGDGSFQYNPAPGFTGSDTFTYTVTDASGKTDTATVTLTVTGLVWFVDDSAAPGGDGRLTTPFNCLTGAGCFNLVAADDPGDNIFLYNGTYNNTSVFALLDTQKLIGQGSNSGTTLAAITGVTVPTHSDALPALTGDPSTVTVNSTAAGIQVEQDNTLRGFTVGNTSSAVGNYDVQNSTTQTVGTLNISELILNGTGGLFRADAGGVLAITLNSASTTAAGSDGFLISGASGLVTVNGTGTISGVAGVDVNIIGGTVSFTSSGNITHTANTAMVSVTGGHATGTVTFTGTLNATNGTGLQFDNADSTTSYNFNGTTTLNGGDAGIDILNGSVGTFSFGTGTSINRANGVAGAAFNLADSNANVTYSGSMTLGTSTGNMVAIDNHDAGTMTFQTGTLTKGSSTTQGITITNCGGGTINFNNPTISITMTGGKAVNLATNTGATINFTPAGGGNGIDLTSTTATTFDATGGGTFVVTGPGNTLSSTTGTALNVVNTTIGASDLTFVSISSNGSPSGIILNNTGSVGGLNVTGTGTTDGSGGTIQNTTGDAISLTTTRSVVLKNMVIGDNAAVHTEPVSATNNIGDDGISATSVTPVSGDTYGLDIDNLKIARTAGGGIDGAGGGNIGLHVNNTEIINPGDVGTPSSTSSDEDAIGYGSGFAGNADQLTGTVLIENSTFAAFIDHGIQLENAGSGTLDMTVSNVTMKNNDGLTLCSGGPCEGSAIQVIADGSTIAGGAGPTINLTVKNLAVTNIDQDGIDAIADPGGNINVTVGDPANNATNGMTFNCPNGDQVLRFNSGSPDSDDVATFNFNVRNVIVQNSSGTLVIFKAANQMTGKFINSTLDQNNATATTLASRGIEITADGDASTPGSNEVPLMTILIDNVTLNRIGGDGIQAFLTDVTNASSRLDLTIQNCNIGTNPANTAQTGLEIGLNNSLASEGIEVRNGVTTTNNGQLYLHISNNNIRNATSLSGSADGIDIDTEFLSTSHVTVVNNDIFAAPGTTDYDLAVEATTAFMCADFTGNNDSNDANSGADFTNSGDPTTDFQVEGGSGSLAGNNPGTSPFNLTGTFGSGTCTMPNVPTGGFFALNNQSNQQIHLASLTTQVVNDLPADIFASAENVVNIATQPATAAAVTQSSMVNLANALAHSASEVHSLIASSASAEVRDSSAAHHAAAIKSHDSGVNTAEVAANHAAVSKLETRNSTVAPAVTMSGETVGPIVIGTLAPGDSVTITYQVTVNNPPGLSLLNPARVSNQGTVSGSNFSNVLTDDTAVVGPADPTETLVDLFDSQTTLGSDLNPSNSGDNVTFTATVAIHPSQVPTPPSPVTPTGTVDFIDTSNGNAVICNDVALNGSAQATCSTSSLTAGTHNIRADYSGDGNYDTSQSNIVAQVVVACVTNPVVTKIADTNDGVCDADCSLREAIGQVCSGSTITFNTAGVFATPQTITLSLGELSVARNVTIDGPDLATQKVTVSGGGASRVFNINSGKTVTMRELTITGGSVVGTGGGILNDHGTLTLSNTTISGNAASGGGGVYVDGTTSGSASLTVSNSTISGNTATASGGGIQVSGSGGGAATLVMTNSTISGNNADVHGGGLYANFNTTSTLTNVTITNNRADNDNNSVGSGGGIGIVAGAITTLHNTIVAGNFNEDGVTDARDDINGALDAASTNNLIGDGTNMTGVTHGNLGNQVGTGVTPIDALLAVLADNGGLTQTHALSPTSPAVEAGSNTAATNAGLTTDQRGTGFPRIADSADANTTDTVDIGAFELHPSVENIADKTTAEDTAFNFDFNIGDDSASLITSVVATSSNQTLVPDANLVETDGTANDGVWNLSITPAANANSPADGTATITVTVTASNGRTAVDTFVVTVTEVNDAPVPTNDTVGDIGEDCSSGCTGPVYVIPFATLLGNDTNKGAANESGQTVNITGVSAPAGGTVAINGTNVEFTPTANFSGPAGFTYTVTDNGTTNAVSDPQTGNATVSFNITAVNDNPVVATNTGLTVSEGSLGNTITSAKLSVTDVDNTASQIVFTIGTAPANGTLKKSGGALAGGGTFTQDDINNNLITYDHDGTNTTSDSFTFTVSDGAGGTIGLTTFNITVTAANDAPVVTTTVANLSYAENDPATAVDSGVTITDSDNANLTGATVSITTNFQSGQDVLGWIDNNGADNITLSGSSTAQTIILTGSDTVANYQAAVRAVTYVNTSENPSTVTRTVTFTANDGTDTGSNTRNIDVASANDAPVNTVPVAQGTSVNTPLTFSSGNGNQISVADADAGAGAVKVTLTVTNGTLTLNGTTGLDFSGTCSGAAGDGTADTTMTFCGTLTDINNALNGMTYTSAPAFSGADSLTITSNDQGNTGGAAQSDTDVVNIQVATNVSINDAQVPEPSSGTVDMTFTVALNAPAGGAVSVNFQTNDGTANAGTCGNPGADYVATNGTVNFAVGEQVKTINVPICSDNVADNGETFTVTLSLPSGVNIVDGTATGTITANTAGTVLISELRTSGPGGAGDDFVEIYNNSNSPLTVAASDASAGYGLYKMGADCNAAPVLIGVIPNGTVIPARGHYLFVGSAYSLANYGGTGAAAGNLTLSSDIETDGNVGLFTTSEVTAVSSVNRLDAVGFGANVGGACNLLREGSNLPAIAANATIEHSYFRKQCDWLQGQGCTVPGIPKDTNSNAEDFWLADTAGSAITGRLGAPGPENLASPIRRDNSGVNVFLLDGTVGSGAAPNRKRDGADPAGTFGSMTLRYRVTNNTGANVTRLRYRVVDISTAIQPPGPTADLRALTSSSEPSVGPVNDTVTCTSQSLATPCTVTVTATTLETPPNQAIGGGYNSTLSSGTVTTGTPLPNGQSILINFKLGVQKTGTFRFYIIVEALP